jgi:hypothetical protein
MLTRLPENYFAPSLGHENDMVLLYLSDNVPLVPR